jgi:hypothetical protein
VSLPSWLVGEIGRRARAILAREPTGDVDVHELATLALDLVTRLEQDPSYRGTPPAAGHRRNEAASDDPDATLSEMAALERELGRCKLELQVARRALERLTKGRG